MIKLNGSPTPTIIEVSKSDIIEHITENLNMAETYFVQNIENCARTLYRQGFKIQAIKLLKTVFPLGLKQAKEYVELNYID